MEGINFLQVWISVLSSLTYCYLIGERVPKGALRLLCVIPILCLFLFLPLKLHTVSVGGSTAFFIAWLANFKLLLFAYGKGPLSSDPSLSLARFMAVGCLPIEIPQNPSPQGAYPGSQTDPSSPKLHLNGQNGGNPRPRRRPTEGDLTPLNLTVKCMILAVLFRALDFRPNFHPNLALSLYCVLIYLFLEILLALAATLARGLLGAELEPQFNEPYLSTSLQDFWGRRWNLMVTKILRPTVYDPTRRWTARVLGRRWASIPAVMATFVVSGLVHELIFFYLGRVRPTWEVTWFFVVHGLCLSAEIVLKKALAGWGRLPRVLSGPLAVGFVMVTSFWLFFPQFVRCRADVRIIEECAAVGAFLQNATRALIPQSV